MGQSYYANGINPGGLNQPGSFYGASYTNFGYPSPQRGAGYGGSPIFGPMQGGGYGQNGFIPSDSQTDQRMANLLNVTPLQNMVNREIGLNSNSQDNNDPLNYVNQRITPIISKAKTTYNEAMKASGGKVETAPSDNKHSSRSNSPSSVPLDSSSGG